MKRASYTSQPKYLVKPQNKDRTSLSIRSVSVEHRVSDFIVDCLTEGESSSIRSLILLESAVVKHKVDIILETDSSSSEISSVLGEG